MVIYKCDKCKKTLQEKEIEYAYIPADKYDADRCIEGRDIRRYMLCHSCTTLLKEYMDMEINDGIWYK